jgi:hypothetical protein
MSPRPHHQAVGRDRAFQAHELRGQERLGFGRSVAPPAVRKVSLGLAFALMGACSPSSNDGHGAGIGAATGGDASVDVTDAGDRSDDSSDAGGLVLQVGVNPYTTGALSGLVRDFDSKKSIAGATIAIDGGGASMTTASDGTFTLTAPLGRVEVSVTMTGYVPSHAEFAIGTASVPVRINLRTLAPTQSVGAAGATLTSGAAALAFSAGAYAAPTNVSATWLDGNALVATMRTIRAVDAAGASHVVLGALHVETATEPTSAATLTVPVPTGVDSSTVSLIERAADGTFGTPIAPASVTISSAVFSVSHFSDYVDVGPGDPNAPSIFTPQADPGSTATLDDGSTISLDDGTVVNSGTALISTARDTAIEAVDTLTDTAAWYWNTGSALARMAFTAATTPTGRMSVEPVDESTYSTNTPPGSFFGVLRWYAPIIGPGNLVADTVNAMFSWASGQIFDRGTVFTVENSGCPSLRVETSEGEVEVVTTDGTTTTVTAGQVANTPGCCASAGGAQNSCSGNGSCGNSGNYWECSGGNGTLTYWIDGGVPMTCSAACSCSPASSPNCGN